MIIPGKFKIALRWTPEIHVTDIEHGQKVSTMYPQKWSSNRKTLNRWLHLWSKNCKPNSRSTIWMQAVFFLHTDPPKPIAIGYARQHPKDGFQWVSGRTLCLQRALQSLSEKLFADQHVKGIPSWLTLELVESVSASMVMKKEWRLFHYQKTEQGSTRRECPEHTLHLLHLEHSPDDIIVPWSRLRRRGVKFTKEGEVKQ